MRGRRSGYADCRVSTASKKKPPPATPLRQQLDVERTKIDVDHFDLTVRELIRMSEEGELHRAPEYQRHFRWDEETESRLIESLFLGLPVPSLFVATNTDGTWEVVDGLQRLSTLLHFGSDNEEMLAEIGKDEPLRLEGLEKIEDFNGHSYQELPTPLQLAFNRRALRVTALSDKSDFGARFDMFERLNTGGVALTPQEVRACIFLGSFNDLLRELAENDKFKALVKLQRAHHHDATREEIVLKFFAYLNNRERFDGAVTEFLNDYMEKSSRSFDIEAGRELFLSVIEELYSVTGGKPVLRGNYPNTPINQFEAILVGLGEIIRGGKAVAKPPKGWLNDKELVASSTKGTNTPSMLKRRITRSVELLS